MLKLVATELSATTKERLYRMMLDVRCIQRLTPTEMRAAYDYIEAMRDEFSKMLDRMDGKHV